MPSYPSRNRNNIFLSSFVILSASTHRNVQVRASDITRNRPRLLVHNLGDWLNYLRAALTPEAPKTAVPAGGPQTLSLGMAENVSS
jgi:hypothetical protein